jgi:hypothetical protein
MATTPAGRPAWSRTADHANYGGNVNKANYQSQGVVNPKTDVGAEAIARLTADLAACARTGSFLDATILCNDGSPGAPTVESALMMTGVRTASYAGDAAPTGFPAVARNGTGDFTITFASSYDDPYGVAEAFVPRGVLVSCHGTTFADATWVISGQTVRIRVFDAAGSALADRRVSVVVW